MNNDINKYIEEIIIGPNCKAKYKEIKKFLDLNKIRCDIKISNGNGIYANSLNHKSNN